MRFTADLAPFASLRDLHAAEEVRTRETAVARPPHRARAGYNTHALSASMAARMARNRTTLDEVGTAPYRWAPVISSLFAMPSWMNCLQSPNARCTCVHSRADYRSHTRFTGSKLHPDLIHGGVHSGTMGYPAEVNERAARQWFS
jgi:hypothetical protein